MDAANSWEMLREGQSVGPLTKVVSEDSVRAYCAAMAADPAICLAPDDGAPSAPPSLFATAYSALLKPHLNLGYGLMSRQTTEAHAPLEIGGEVTLTGHIAEKFERKGRHYWTLVYDVTGADGSLCVRNRVTCSVD